MNPKFIQKIASVALGTAMLVTLSVLIFIIFYILYQGLPIVSMEFLTTPIRDMGKSGGIFPTIISTFYLAFLSICIAAPLGIGTAVFLTEYTRENTVTRVIRFTTDCLAGIPSIIFGLFGFVFFDIYLGFGWSILAGSLTLATMMLPTIIRTSEEAIRAVPEGFREVTYGLGGSKWQSVTEIVLPKAFPGILTGIILSMGRAVSETAALIFTAGMSLHTPVSVLSSGRSMAVHFYTIAREGISLQMAFGTAAVLIVTISIINISSYLLMHKYMRKYA